MASIVPSILGWDFARLGESLEEVQALGVSAIHIDVMDGHFRPEISVGQPVVESIRKATRLKLDVHLMIERPERFIESFVNAGADSLAFHIEATRNALLALSITRRLGTQAGLAMDPATPLEACRELLDDVDFVLVQAGGASHMERCLRRVAGLASERNNRGLNLSIAAEGDFGAGEAEGLLSGGADILVVGSAIFERNERGEALRAFARAQSGDSSITGQELKLRVH
ncbi:MAG TPA: ribulose-phosphate 3-epimerase [Terriglobia bacterium]|jgi:ribulose-phosphate 3-epimerase|nr:ribulose-phosphate 3-epimerase [Terriglobia bacterium]